MPGLVSQSDPGAAVRPRVLEGEPHDPSRPCDGDRLDRDARVGLDLDPGEAPELLPEGVGLGGTDRELDSLIQVLRVLPDHDQVYLLVTRVDSRQRPGGANGSEQVQALPECDVDAAEPRPHRCRDRALDGDPGGADRLEGLLRQEVTMLGERRGSRGPFDPLDPGNRCIEYDPRGRGHLGPDPVTGDQRDAMASCHRGTLSAILADVRDGSDAQVGRRALSSSNQTHAPSAPETSPHRSAIRLSR